uniref:Uncharacterized protein n=1 Tax=Arundo donax TaxID=35708 RepID=A0A0A8XWC8_ARUDO
MRLDLTCGASIAGGDLAGGASTRGPVGGVGGALASDVGGAARGPSVAWVVASRVSHAARQGPPRGVGGSLVGGSLAGLTCDAMVATE